jgi:DNA-binding IclR family transcriptional regulator
MLASLEESEVRRIYSGHPIPGFRNKDQLFAKFRSINRKGYNYGVTNDKGDHTVAIRFENNPCAAIGIAGKITSSEAPAWAERLRAVARKIESQQVLMDL